MSVGQKQKSIDSLHEAAIKLPGIDSVLEISTKSRQELGVRLSAFNLEFRTAKSGRTFSVEAAYQSSKIFERGGPFKDLLESTAREAKSDARLRESGRLVEFCFFGVHWELEPRTAFYNWLYVNALLKHPELARELSSFSAFTDIEFNPEKSLNCQAYSAALFVALQRRNLVSESLRSKSVFLEVASGVTEVNSLSEDAPQRALGF
jgi:hypothetical protein